MNHSIFKKNKRAEPALITIILLIFLILTVIALMWRVILTFANEGTGEIFHKTDCLRTKIEIIKVNNNFENNLILARGTGYGKLTGIKVFLDNQDIENIPINISEMEEKAFTIQNNFLRNNPNSVGKYVKIAKLIGDEFNSSKVCDFDGKSAEIGVQVVSA